MSLIASVLHLDRAAVKALAIKDPYSLHKVVYSLYDDIRTDEEKNASISSGILFADQGGDYKHRKILLLANRQPKNHVNGVDVDVQSKPIPEVFLQQKQYRFTVLVNPTYRDSASRKLVPVKGREAIAQWFIDRTQSSWGFKVQQESLQVGNVEVLQFADKKQRKVTLAQAQIQGFLEVSDQEKFAQSFAKGIGRGRAFGCGLLQIAPIVDNPFA